MEDEARIVEPVTSEVKPPNVIWTADPKAGEPKTSVKIGMRTIGLPSAEEQRKGFYSEQARRLIANIKGYKRFQSKG